eukprot:TRINITY_DN3953_c0_g1_i1.p1 TRINITY_DN3953_c0_g1~~TRINITY_DN3953_c0_g1_i1.p1  ORF type:complete len:332 (+),score=113.74 TRINITY_DN3953_c0_g1_i1:37-1032(+)
MGDSRSSSEDPTAEGEWVLYRERPDWADVTPLPQDDGPSPVVQIAYTERFKDVYDYFRAVLKSGEKSGRVLQLTEDALELNPANYTVWHYRRVVLKAIGADIKEELQYCREIIEEHPKNYQVWQHRRALIELLNEPGTELRFTEVILAIDQKNYHAWQHRQWVLQAFSLYEGELDFIDRLLLDDIRNNSAWNQRFFVISHSGGWSSEAVEREVKYTLEKIQIVKRNESAWNYLRGVLEHCEESGTADTQRALVKEKCQELLAAGCESPFLLGFLVELLQYQLEEDTMTEKAELISTATDLCVRLSKDIDTVRCRYWDFVSDTITSKHSAQA